MATCYICGAKNATYRRDVYTGNSYRTTFTSRGNVYSSASAHYGTRSVCASCALDIDYNNKKHLSFGTLIALFIIPLIPVFFFVLHICFSDGKNLHAIKSAIIITACCLVGVIIIASILKTKKKQAADIWYQQNKAKYIGDSIHVSQYTNKEQSKLTDSSSESKWECSLCGYSDNPTNDYCCKNCNSARYTFATLPQEEKQVALQYSNKVLDLQNYEDILRVQEIYFYTTGISFLAYLFPDVKNFTDLDSYKTSIRSVISPENPQKSNSLENPQKQTCTPNDVALKSTLSTISERIQQELKILDTKQNYINTIYSKLILYTVDDCNKALSDLNSLEKEIEQTKKTILKFCNDCIKQLNKSGFDKEALSYSESIIENAKLTFNDITNQLINQLKQIENQALQAKIKILEQGN